MSLDLSTVAVPATNGVMPHANGALAVTGKPVSVVEKYLALPAARDELRRRVEETTQSVRAIARDLGLPPASLARFIGGEDWTPPPGAPEPLGASPKGRRRLASDIAEAGGVAARLLRAVDRQIVKVEGRLKRRTADIEEKDARILATLARTLATLMALGKGGAEAQDTEHPDIDHLRAELSRRITRWAAGGEEPSGTPGEPAA